MKLAAKRGWDGEAFAACIDSEESFQRVRNDIEVGHRAKVVGTPTVFFNGRLERL